MSTVGPGAPALPHDMAAAEADAPSAVGRAGLAVTGRYLPGLDGVRALAVSAVVVYHLGFSWASGGYLGVDLFFVLSGFLITSLLLEEWVVTRTIALGAFWARRARRLLPALFLVLVAIALYVVLNGRYGPATSAAQVDLSGLRGDALATLFYVANWHAIFAHQSYFAQFAAPSPLNHTWSLAIEEQFYLLWPPLLFLALPRLGPHWRRIGVGLAVVGALASATAMALIADPTNPTRVYEGTDTRIFDMLIGAVVAFVAAARPQPGPAARRALHAAALPALAVLVVFWVVAGTPSQTPRGYMYDGGFLLCAVLAAVVVADVRQLHRGPLGVALAWAPLRYLGRISYGVYLWHWPIFVFLTPARTGWSDAWCDVARLALTLVLATTSYYLVERPIRRRAWTPAKGWGVTLAAVAATAAAVVVGTIPAVAAPTTTAPTAAPVTPARGQAVPGAGGFAGQVPIALPPGRHPSPADPLRVMLIGDSVMDVASPGIIASLGATGESVAVDDAPPGFGLSPGPGGFQVDWRTALPSLIAQFHPDLIVGTWSWDDGPPRYPNALQAPAAYTKELESAIDLMLTPGNGVAGVIFAQFPLSGPVLAQSTAASQSETRQRTAGQLAWQRIVAAMPARYPGKVMYLPVASSVLLHGKFTSWLPPVGKPDAPSGQWTRVRMVDDVHLCPAGVVRYSDALLVDLTDLFHLAPAKPGWWAGSWTSDPRYNTPPGSCPNDHP